MATNKFKLGTETPSKLYMGDVEVTKAYMGETLVYEKSSSSGETWVINNTPTLIDLTSNINFVSNNETFNTIYITPIGGMFTASISYDDYEHYNPNNGWDNQAYRTITFATPPTGALLTWLQANAVKK